RGGAGLDTADYRGSPAGVTVRLHTATATGGDATGDTFAALVRVEYTDGNGNPQTEQVPDIEHLHGSGHADILAGDSRDNTLAGGGGDDKLYGGPGGGDDALYGGAGADALYGGRGNDTLSGNAGDDTLHGGPDDDTLYGGAGNDTFVFAPGHGDDTLPDFGHGDDRIDLAAFDGIDGIDDLSLSQTDRGLIIDLSGHGGETLTLEGYHQPDALSDADFIF
ncbi:MAG: calcium-binding protein, partial [Gammaproteobacteria bacterium]|nr:calcium-binding protein [Gammaproteobacteria bacterium]